ncbi:hypothetical protein [Streptomyces sp. SM12]|uniref:hypothetical protein n=1 Tax=Streptomyces sp. SM12 TaxID=1071602 RepID=UPI0011B05990|nr:hypothetical protein [Streptomyces sp. SM12]
MRVHIFAGDLDDEIEKIREEGSESDCREIRYVRFPRLYAALRWRVSDRERDERRGFRVLVFSQIFLALVVLREAVYSLTDGSILWPAGWEVLAGALISLVILVMHWEPYRQDGIPVFHGAMLMQVVLYSIIGFRGLLALAIEPASASWGAIAAFPVCAVFLWCWRAGRKYELEVLRGER